MDSKEKNSTKKSTKHVKRVKKSKHQKIVEKRLKQWSPYHDVMLESLMHPTKNGECFLSLRQFQSDNQKDFGDILVLHSSNLDLFIRHLIGMKKRMNENIEQDKQETNIVIDEWDLTLFMPGGGRFDQIFV